MKKTIRPLLAALALAVLLSACGAMLGTVYCDVDGSTYKMSDIINDDSLLAKTVMRYESAGSVVNYRGEDNTDSDFAASFGTLTGVRGYYEVTAPAPTVLSFRCEMTSSRGTCKLVVAGDDGVLYTAQGSVTGLVEVPLEAGTSRVALAGDSAEGTILFGLPTTDDPAASVAPLWQGGFLGEGSIGEEETPA